MELQQQEINEAVVEKYLLLKAQIDALTGELDELKQHVMPIVEQNNGKLQFNDSTLILAERKTYEYSQTVKDFEEEIKKQKKIEEIQGTVKVKSTTKYLTVRAA